MFLKEFEIRWDDLDANWHLSNTSYMSYAGHVRMELLKKIGVGHTQMIQSKLGPVVFNEQISYFKEVLPDQRIQVSAALSGMSADGMFFRFHHDFYFKDGTNLARIVVTGGWIDLKTRKLTALPKALCKEFFHAPKTDDFKILTAADTRQGGQKPEHLKNVP